MNKIIVTTCFFLVIVISAVVFCPGAAAQSDTSFEDDNVYIHQYRGMPEFYSRFVDCCEPWFFPVPDHPYIFSPFGYRPGPFSGHIQFHNGIDISPPHDAAALGIAVHAARSGIVTTVVAHHPNWPNGTGNGNFIRISHPCGHDSVYAHLRPDVLVHVGQFVRQGEIIAFIGNSGSSTGPHLHFGIIRDGVHVNTNAYDNRYIMSNHPERYSVELSRYYPRVSHRGVTYAFNGQSGIRYVMSPAPQVSGGLTAVTEQFPAVPEIYSELDDNLSFYFSAYYELIDFSAHYEIYEPPDSDVVKYELLSYEALLYMCAATSLAYSSAGRAAESLAQAPEARLNFLAAGNNSSAITRAEFAALAVAFYESKNGEITGRVQFADTNNINAQKLAYLGVVNGVGNNMFAPDEILTRQQAAVILVRLSEAIGKTLPEGSADFADFDKISPWAKSAVGRVVSANIIPVAANNYFLHNGAFTENQSITAITKLFELTRF